MAIFSVGKRFGGLFARTALCAVIAVIAGRASIDGNQSPTPDRKNDAEMYLHRGLHLAELYRWPEAATDFQAAESRFDAIHDKRNALYARLGLLRATIERHNLLRAASDLQSQIETSSLLNSDKQLRMFCLIVKGDVDQEIDVRAARRDWEQVDTLARELGDERWQNRALAQIGIAAFYGRDLETARKNVATAVAVATKIHDVAAEIRFTTVLGKALIEANMFEQAMTYTGNAIAIAKQNPETGYPFLSYETEIEALTALKRYDEAQQVVDDLMRHSKSSYRTPLQADILPAAARIAIARGNIQLGIDDLHRTIAICKREGYQREEAVPEAMLSAMYRNSGDLTRAEFYASAAARSSQFSGDRWSLPDRLRVVAEIEEARGEYRESDRAYQKASDFIDTGLANASSVLEKNALINASGTLFPQHFALIARRLRDPERAYSVLEQVRGRVTTDLLVAGSADSHRAQQVERRIANLQLQMMSAQTSAELEQLSDEVFRTEELRWITPGVSILKHKTRGAVPLTEVRRSLEPSAAILEYVLAEPQSYCLVITRDMPKIISLPGKSRIEFLADTYLKKVRQRLAADTEAQQLYNVLLKPIADVHNRTNLVIVPDGELHRIPFDALESAPATYVVDSHVVAYAPSTSAFYLLTRDAARSSVSIRPLLGVGGVPYTRAKLKSGFESQDRPLLDLTYSKQETLDASTDLGGSNDLLVGEAASESRFKRAVGHAYGSVHIAAHGIPNNGNPDDAAIVLLPDARAGEDGFLHATEVAMMHLKIKLVVLSACDTAAGPIEGEEGIATLSNSFLLAGARSVISTLWSADDNAALFLTHAFYSRLAAGENPALALTDAKRGMLKTFGRSTALPFYWAGFKYEGPITFGPSAPQ